MPRHFLNQSLKWLSTGLLLSVTLFTAAQTDIETVTSTLAATEGTAVEMLVSVRDTQNAVVTDLPRDRFQVTEDGTPLSITSFEESISDEVGIAIVLVIDTSDSMAGRNLETAKRASQTLFSFLGPKDEVALVAFNDEPTLIQAFTTDHELVKQALNTLESTGRTALYDASYFAVETALASSQQPRFVVLLSDGNEYGGLSVNTASNSIDLAELNAVTVYGIGLGTEINRSYLQEFTSRTHGQLFLPQDANQLEDIYKEIGLSFRAFRHRYRIGVQLPFSTDAERSLLVSVDGIDQQSSITYRMPFIDNSMWRIDAMIADYGFEMVRVPAGCFLMGQTSQGREETSSNAEPVHEQCFERDFWIDRYEITNAQIAAAQLDVDFQRESSTVGADYPHDSATWFEASEFCHQRGGHLPTEAEWEYAARGPSNWIYPWGNIFEDSFEYVVYLDNSEGQSAARGGRTAGASWVGAEDMSGNMWEWTQSLYRPYPYDATDGREETTDRLTPRVLRGGSYNNKSNEVYAAIRIGLAPTEAFSLAGFRCVIDEETTP